MSNRTFAVDRAAPLPKGGLWQRTTGGSFALVALGAAMWGTDPLFRQDLALNMPAPAIVAFEQALPALLLSPLVWRGLRRALSLFDWRDWSALVVLGCGSSALATLLFTLAFTYDRPDTPVLLQQLQPLFAVVGARVVLGERFHTAMPSTFSAGSSVPTSSPSPIPCLSAPWQAGHRRSSPLGQLPCGVLGPCWVGASARNCPSPS